MPNGSMEVASQGVVWTAVLCLSDFPFYKSLGHVGTDVCTGRMQFACATNREHRKEKKKGLDPKRREKAAITHWPRESEPECSLPKQFVVTQHQKYEVHTNQER